MLGSITSVEKCPICQGRMQDNGFTAVACPKHPRQIARKLRVRLERKKGEATQKQFTRPSGLESYRHARRFLDGLRFKIEEGTFDHRDYKSDNPLGYQTLVEEWLSRKEKKLTPEAFRPLKLYAHKYAVPVWGNRNVKTIGFREIEKFLAETLEHLSSKSRANAKSALHDFFQWLLDREDLQKMPKFPTVDVVMEMRNLLDKDSQLMVLDKLRELTWDINPRIWLCVKWLATYFSIRPKEMLSLKEKHVDLKRQVFIVPPLHDKTGRGKIIPMLPEDVELARSLPRSLDQEQPFFRHIPVKPTRWTGVHIKRTVPGRQFRHDFISSWWDRACAAVGIAGVSLYPGTKHTSVSALCEDFTPEQIKTSSHISTNEAFARYFQPNPKMVKSIYGAARGDGRVTDILSRNVSVS